MPCDLFVSRDGGGTWTRHVLEVDRCIDPWVLQDADGQAFQLRSATLRMNPEVRRNDERLQRDGIE